MCLDYTIITNTDVSPPLSPPPSHSTITPTITTKTFCFIKEEFIEENGTFVSNINKNDIIQSMISVKKNFVIIPDDIELPFPPSLKAESFVDLSEPFRVKESVNNKRKRKSEPKAKAPNKFFVYRKAWVDELKKRNIQYPMTVISGYISGRWVKESPEVKQAYIEIANKVKELHKAKYGTFKKLKTSKDSNTYKKNKDIIRGYNVNRINEIKTNKTDNNAVNDDDNNDNDNYDKSLQNDQFQQQEEPQSQQKQKQYDDYRYYPDPDFYFSTSKSSDNKCFCPQNSK